jgi:hypothetical protein
MQPTDDYLVKVTDSLNYYEWDAPYYFDSDGFPMTEESLSEEVEPIEEEEGSDLTSLKEYLERTEQDQEKKKDLLGNKG